MSPRALPPQQILCVPRAGLEARLGSLPHGFSADARVVAGLQAAVRGDGEFRPRPELEEDPTYLQVIVQALVTRGDDVLALFRKARAAQAGQFVETRHNEKVALSAGGHVEAAEAASADLLRAALQRELREELVFEHAPHPAEIRPLGVLCLAAPTNDLFDRVHIGFVFHVPTTGGASLPEGSDEFTHIEFVSGDRLRELQPRMENWGNLLAEAILDGRLVLPTPASLHL